MRFHNMKLHLQLILIVGITMFFVFLGMIFATQFFVGELNHQIVQKTNDDIELAIDNVIASNAKRLYNLSMTHSYWTDLVTATEREDSAWIHENATAYLINDPSYEVDLIYLENTSNAYNERYGNLPASLYKELYSEISGKPMDANIVSFLITYNKKHFVVSMTPLMDTNMTKTYGFMAVGHQIDKTISTVLTEQFINIADVKLHYVETEEPIISRLHFGNLKEALHSHMTIEANNLKLTKMISDSSTTVLFSILGFLILGMFILLYMLLKISSNFRVGIEQIKSITYSDYSKKINLSFSQDFKELSDCINNLSDQLSRRDQDINQNYVELVSLLIKTLEEVDYYTKGHSERVAHYSVELAKAINFHDIETVKLSGLLHDVGKVTVDINILNKPGKLTTEEFDEIKKHPVTGANILEMSSVFAPIKAIVKHHHEKIDGSGYPDGLKQDEIPMGAKIVAVADVFDSLTSNRSYRDPMSIEEALRIIREGSGTHFEPSLVDAFEQIARTAYNTWSLLSDPPNAEELILEAGRVMNEQKETLQS